MKLTKEDIFVARCAANFRDYCNRHECDHCVFHNDQKRVCTLFANKECLIPGAIKMDLSKIEIDESELMKIKESYPQVKYIAKDLDGGVCAFIDKPYKDDGVWMNDGRMFYKVLNMDNYPTLDILLSWDDEEPYEIKI